MENEDGLGQEQKNNLWREGKKTNHLHIAMYSGFNDIGRKEKQRNILLQMAKLNL